MRSFDEFIKEYQGRSISFYEKVDNFLYQFCRQIEVLVISDIEEKNEYVDQQWYQEHKKEIRRLLKATVITTIWASGAADKLQEASSEK